MDSNSELTTAQRNFILEVEEAMRQMDARSISLSEGYQRLINAFQSHKTEQKDQ